MEEQVSTSSFDFINATSMSDNTFSNIQPIPSAGFSLLAKAKRNGKWWMLKGLKNEYSQTPVFQEAIRKEYDILSSLHHPGIVSVDSIEEVDGIGCCIVMEYIHGVNLRQAINKGLSISSRHKIAHELMDAIEYIHKKQIVHRDLKPSNIMLAGEGEYVKIIDFGLSDSNVYTFLKQPSGTDRFMSPEQKANSTPDIRNDIYSLGCVLECLDLGKRYSNIIARCKKPINERYQTIEMLRKDYDKVAKLPSIISFSILAAVFAAVALVSIHYHWMDDIYSFAKTIRLTDYSFYENGIYYNILSKEDATVEVTYNSEKGPYKGDITIPDHVTHNGVNYTVVRIGNRAFANSPIIAVVLPQTIKSLGNCAFIECDSLATLYLPDSISEIGDSTIRDCSYIRSVHYPSSMAKVPPYTFSGCGSLHSLHLHEGITTLERDAFGGCLIDSITLPSSLRTIERGAFWACENMKLIRIPAGIERIGDFVFWHCNSLSDIYIDRPTPLAITNIFHDLHGVKLHVPKGSADLYRNAEGWKELEIME